jgi:hypothetical protein
MGEMVWGSVHGRGKKFFENLKLTLLPSPAYCLTLSSLAVSLLITRLNIKKFYMMLALR